MTATPPLAVPGTAPSVRQLLLRLLLAAYIPAAVVVGVLQLVQYRQERSQAFADMTRFVRVMTETVDDRVASVQEHLVRLSEAAVAEPLDLAALHAEALIEQRLAQVDGVVLFDASGRQLLNTRIPQGVPLAPTPPTVDVLAARKMGRPTVSDLFFAATARRHMVGVGVPVVSGNQIPYVLAAGLDAARLHQLVQRHRPAPGWTMKIVDRRGIIVASTDDPDGSGTFEAPEIMAITTGQMQGATEMSAARGTPMAVAYRRSAMTGWMVVVEVPERVLYGQVWLSMFWTLLALSIPLAVGFALAWRWSRRIAGAIEHLGEGARQLRDGEMVRLPALPVREADDFARALEAASGALQARDAQLQRVTERFEQSVLSELERWQGQVGRELHDSVGSALGGVSLVLASARPMVPPGGLAAQLIERSQAEVSAALELVRKVSRGVMPAGIDPGALLPALEHFARDQRTWHGIDCRVLATGDFQHITPEVGNHVYRIVQEAVGNARRHGGAARIVVELVETAAGYDVRIADDGRGADFGSAAVADAGIGLRSMRVRAQAIGGTLELLSGPGGGCEVRLAWDRAPPAAPSPLVPADAGV